MRLLDDGIVNSGYGSTSDVRIKLTHNPEEPVMGIIAKKLQRLNGRSRNSRDGTSDQGLAIFSAPLPSPRSVQPSSGSAVCDGLTLYHDAKDGNFFWQQTKNNSLQLTVYQFDGSYLSLAAGMKEDQIAQLRQSGFLHVLMAVRSSRPITAFLRLNAQIDGRTEQMHQTFVIDQGTRSTSFDLDGLPGEFGPIENAWLDLILVDPRMVEIKLSSLTLRDAAPAVDEN